MNKNVKCQQQQQIEQKFQMPKTTTKKKIKCKKILRIIHTIVKKKNK